MSQWMTVDVPDIGDFQDVEIIEVLVKVGDPVAPEDPLITLESDKASIDIPAPRAGVVRGLRVKVGDRVSQGDPILELEEAPQVATARPMTAAPPSTRATGASVPVASTETNARLSHPGPAAVPAPAPPRPADPATAAASAASATPAGVRSSPTAQLAPRRDGRRSHATPGVRRFARELGVDLAKVEGSGRKRRILREDVQGFVKRALSPAAGSTALGIDPMPDIDFSQFGPVETLELTKINKLSGKFLHRSWLTVPHVTHFDEADITELEDFRKSLKKEYDARGIRITFLPFLMKAMVSALRQHPRFNASLDASGERLILKRYFHLGVAVDTPDGLVVPVIRDVDRKSLGDLAKELMDVSQRARDRRLKPADLEGGCLTISSLGGIGGTGFTPILNTPEVAILGVSRSSIRPVWNGSSFEPRLILPLALSYDHRVIDGALGARFMATLAGLLSDMRRMLL